MASQAAHDSPVFLSRLPRGRWWVVAGAFLSGWLLFALVWLSDRGEGQADPAPVKAVAAPEAFEPLPRPMAAGERATPLPEVVQDAPVVIEEATPAPAPATIEEAPLPPSIEEPAATTVAAPAQAPSPLAEYSPSPTYPAAAMRRSESGTVVVEVEVDAAGLPVSVEVGQRSGSRDLDRAAVEAVSGWRFEPARDAAGNPVPGRLSVPIDFKLE